VAAYGRFSAWRLRQMTHREPPWLNARAGWPVDEPSQMPVSEDELKRFFKVLRHVRARKAEGPALAESLRQSRAGQTSPFIGE
jgi:Lon protease-like protein